MQTQSPAKFRNVSPIARVFILTLSLLSFGLFMAGCDDDDPTGPKTPTVTPTPIGTATPTPLPPGTSMRVRVTNIPVMSDENKDSVNKQALFCIKSGGHEMGVYHRYMQPGWPDGPWWPCYKLEYFINGDQVEEVEKADWEELPDGTATFVIDFSNPSLITVHCEENDSVESITENHPMEFQLSRDCMGNDSPCIATVVN